MDNTLILNHINTHFHKLFINCTDAHTFIPPTFNNTNDIDTLITLYQIINIISTQRLSPNLSNTILYQVLVQIINIKCKEHVEQSTSWNKNVDNFISSFEKYINSLIKNTNFT